MRTSLSTMRLSQDNHVVLARQQAREIAGLLGFESHDQTRIATAVSEVSRDLVSHSKSGEIEFLVEQIEQDQWLMVEVKSRKISASEIRDSDNKRERSLKGYSGITAAQRLMDQFHVDEESAGATVVIMGKRMPSSSFTTQLDLQEISSEILCRTPKDPIEEIKQQNLELVNVLEALRNRQDELTNLNQELEDTNRGVLALYGELEQRSEYLKKANEIKSRSLSEMSHELRTPINSILAITQILLDRTDGDLTAEQEKQLSFIKRASNNLSDLINDLLDLSKIEAGKIQVHATDFDVRNLFGSLRSMLKPLLLGQPVELIFEDPTQITSIFSDEGKVSQILRNLISNAIKFTEQGEVRVSTFLEPEGRELVFSIVDTGVGIASEHHELIFQEFSQVQGALQQRYKGTGLGLPLSRKLAEILGGTISFQSQPGKGSTFLFSLPVQFRQTDSAEKLNPVDAKSHHTVLIIEDDLSVTYAYEAYLRESAFRVIHARNISDARALLKSSVPMAIVLDILLPGEDGWGFLSEIRNNPATMHIPVLVCTVVDEPRKAAVLGAQDFCVKPIPKKWLLEKLESLAPVKKILIVDDDDSARYVLKRLLADTVYTIIEASDGNEGLRRAYEDKPDIIFLDLVMPGMNGFDTLRHLKVEPKTRDIPVIVVTSKELEKDEVHTLEEQAVSVLNKEGVTRMAAMEMIKDALAKIRSI